MYLFVKEFIFWQLAINVNWYKWLPLIHHLLQEAAFQRDSWWEATLKLCLISPEGHWNKGRLALLLLNNHAYKANVIFNWKDNSALLQLVFDLFCGRFASIPASIKQEMWKYSKLGFNSSILSLILRVSWSRSLTLQMVWCPQ